MRTVGMREKSKIRQGREPTCMQSTVRMRMLMREKSNAFYVNLP